MRGSFRHIEIFDKIFRSFLKCFGGRNDSSQLDDSGMAGLIKLSRRSAGSYCGASFMERPWPAILPHRHLLQYGFGTSPTVVANASRWTSFWYSPWLAKCDDVYIASAPADSD